MCFFNILNNLLTELKIPFYEDAPDFGQESAPQAFIYYHAHDVPKLHGCGKEQVTTYYVTVNIYTTGQNRKARAVSIGNDLTALFVKNGFVRMSGSFGLTDDFPKYYRRIIEFNYDYDLEESE